MFIGAAAGIFKAFICNVSFAAAFFTLVFNYHKSPFGLVLSPVQRMVRPLAIYSAQQARCTGDKISASIHTVTRAVWLVRDAKIAAIASSDAQTLWAVTPGQHQPPSEYL